MKYFEVYSVSNHSQIISVKDKAEVLMEVERLQTVKDELSAEVISLHAQLEQERSKVRALTGNEYKSKDKVGLTLIYKIWDNCMKILVIHKCILCSAWNKPNDIFLIFVELCGFTKCSLWLFVLTIMTE